MKPLKNHSFESFEDVEILFEAPDSGRAAEEEVFLTSKPYDFLTKMVLRARRSREVAVLETVRAAAPAGMASRRPRRRFSGTGPALSALAQARLGCRVAALLSLFVLGLAWVRLAGPATSPRWPSVQVPFSLAA